MNNVGAISLTGAIPLQPEDEKLGSTQPCDRAILVSNSKLRMALDIGRMAAWERDLNTGEVIGTGSFKAILGLSPDAPLAPGALQDIIHPGDAERLNQAITFSIRTKTDFHVEHRVIRADGQVGRVVVRGAALYDESDRPTRLVGVVQDLTERDRIRDELALAQRRQEFLSKLSEQIGNQDDPYQIMETAAKSLAQFLKVDSTGYGEVFEDRNIIVVEREWSKVLFNNEGRVEKISDYDPYVIGPLRQGQAMFAEDVQRDPWVMQNPEILAMFASTNVRTTLTAPLLKNGRLVAIFYVNGSQPRPWPSDDVALVQDVAGRTWMALERARANIRVREMEERLRMVSEALPTPI